MSFSQWDDTRSIFVHIPKTAGTSIMESLYGNFSVSHHPISHYQGIFSEKDFESYFKFALVRKPWDRLFSAYTYFKTSEKGYRKLVHKIIAQYDSFETFVMEELTQEPFRKVARKLSKNTLYPTQHFSSQTDMIMSCRHVENWS